MSISEAIDEFVVYSKKFKLSDPALMARFHRAFRVAEYAKHIAKSENMSAQDINLAMICALLHDIARYEQYTLYHTYEDAKSFDHGDEGYNILLKDNYISKYTTDHEEQQIILKAIKNHNKYEIDNDLSEREMLFAKLVRDADKLDLIKEQGNSINGVIVLNPVYLKPFQEKRLFRNAVVTGEYEITLRTLAFIYDLNFKYSYKFILDNHLIEDKIDLIMGHCSNLGILEYMRKILLEYAHEKLGE